MKIFPFFASFSFDKFLRTGGEQKKHQVSSRSFLPVRKREGRTHFFLSLPLVYHSFPGPTDYGTYQPVEIYVLPQENLLPVQLPSSFRFFPTHTFLLIFWVIERISLLFLMLDPCVKWAPVDGTKWIKRYMHSHIKACLDKRRQKIWTFSPCSLSLQPFSDPWLFFCSWGKEETNLHHKPTCGMDKSV